MMEVDQLICKLRGHDDEKRRPACYRSAKDGSYEQVEDRADQNVHGIGRNRYATLKQQLVIAYYLQSRLSDWS